jgi:hypothetical protein
VPQPNPNPRPSTGPDLQDLGFDWKKYVQQLIRGPSADPGFDWNHWMDLVNRPSPKTWPSTGPDLRDVGFDWKKYVQQLIRGPSPDPGFHWNHWMDLVDRPSPKTFGQVHENQAGPSTGANFGDDTTLDELRPPPLKRPKLASSIVFGQAHEDQVVHVHQPDPGTPSDSTISGPRMSSDSRTLSDSESRTPFDSGAPNPGPSNPRLPIGSQNGLDDEAIQAARYAAKGKAKVLRTYSRHR